jgi:hypothetical protein
MCTFFAAGGVRANPPVDVSVSEAAPLFCTTTNFRVDALAPGGTFPTLTKCADDQPCSDYGYIITSRGPNFDHAVFAVSASQTVFSTTPQGAFVSAPGVGDSPTGFLAFAKHEYAVRFSSLNSRNGEAHIVIVGASAPRLSTVLVRSGAKQTESCLIAGPGTTSTDQFQPVFQTQTTLVAGGKCVAKLTFDANGNVTDVTAEPTDPPCQVGQPEGGVLRINGEPIRNNAGPHGITFGNGTTTCYGPPVPRIPRGICTKSPCP